MLCRSGFIYPASNLCAAQSRCRPASALMQPSSQHGVVAELLCFAGEIGEDHLSYFLGPMPIAGHPTQCRGVNQVDMSAHQFAKSVLITSFNILPQQIRIFHSSIYLDTAGESETAQDFRIFLNEIHRTPLSTLVASNTNSPRGRRDAVGYPVTRRIGS
jgi:hypothetical protein